MLKTIFTKYRLLAAGVITTLFILISDSSFSQLPGVLGRIPGQFSGNNSTNSLGNKGGKRSDTLSFKHRNDLEDSITISFHYLDSLNSDHLDSSIDDFDRIYTVPGDYVTLGNNGTPAYPVLFTPVLKPGWDAGFHAFDLYRYNLENTRFFQTTRPYTLLTYMLATGKEQVIKVLQTQNIKPNWNAGFEYRLISAPGIFQTQNANNNNYRFFSHYQGKKKRYAAYMVIMGNKFGVSENGGIQSDTTLSNPDYFKRFAVPVNLGGDVQQTFNVFSTTVNTGNFYSDFNAFLRQSYDFGIKDSLIINDSTTEYLFYPKFRLQHTINYKTYSYRFQDTLSDPIAAIGDSTIFSDWYGLDIHPDNGLNFWLKDKWKYVSNDFSIRQFPQTKNLGQYLEAGITFENFEGTFSSSPRPQYLVQVFPPAPVSKNFYNIFLHGEYRNKTKNQKWDALLSGALYLTGLNSGDYQANATLTRYLNRRLGNLRVSFQNVNRTPSYIFNGLSAFNFGNNNENKKENITLLSIEAQNPRFTIMARNISIANYAYFKNYYQASQFNGLVNISQISASTKNKIVGHLNLYSDFIVQQTTGNNPIKVPLLFTRQRLAFEGNFFKNLFLSTGLDVLYNTPYEANNFSPVLGQFFTQASQTISNLPTVDAYFDFRIKSFIGLVKVENLNTLDFQHGFGFTNNSFVAPNYPVPGFIFRVGIQWGFVN
jgi:Putative porin